MEFDADTKTGQRTSGGGGGGEDQSTVDAKSFLLKASSQTGLNLYDHLSRVLTKILDEKPNNVVDIFEDLSHDVKREKFKQEDDTIRTKSEKSSEIKLAEVQEKLFLKGDGLNSDAETVEEETDSPLPNLLELCYYFEQAGIGLNREEIVRIWLALSRLTESQPVTNVRFWGKILGTEQNYIVAEVEFREGEGEEEEETDEVEDTVDEPEKERDDEEEEVEIEVDDTPKLTYKPPPVVPKEDNRIGINKKTYFVCNEPGGPWVKLPSVTPAQITTARKIKKFFTGRLDATINSFPPFPGTEANYLRAQIARISAGTHISPLGFYQFDEEEEDDDEGGNRDNFIVNTEFEPIPVKDLVDPTLTNWVHHVQHILPQGRTTWWNPRAKNDPEMENENDDEEEMEQPEEVEPEVGPPLLTPLSEDAEIGTMSPWMTRVSSRMVPQYAIAVVQSCLWPGAHAFCSGKHFDNIYIGWGHKYLAENYNPILPQAAQDEFPTGPEVSEVDDPTPDQEAQLKGSEVQATGEVLDENELEEAPDEDDEDD